MKLLLQVNNLLEIITNKKGLIYLTLFYAILSSCVSVPEGPENSVRFAYQEYYLLEDGEQEIPTNDINNIPYGPISDLGKYQIPLNRIIEHKDHKVFIGLALSGKVSQIVDASKSIGGYTVLAEGGNDLFFKSDSLFVYRHVYEEAVEKLTVVANFTSRDSSIVDSFYNNRAKFLSDKITKDIKK